MYDVIIVGGGIAGLTAAIYSSLGNKNTLLINDSFAGSQISNSVNVVNYPGFNSISGYELINNLKNQALSSGAEIIVEKVININNNEVITQNNTYKTKTIIIANGLKKRCLNIPGEKEFVGRGVSYCATCDGAFFKGKDIVVVGGGNTAFEDVIYLSNICNKVYLMHRNELFKASLKNIELVKNLSNVEIVTNTVLSSICGENNVTSIVTNNGIFDVSGVFIAVGEETNNEMFSNIIELDEYGFIISNNCETNIPNIFVAGDTRTKELRQLVTAASDGAVCATMAINYINKN